MVYAPQTLKDFRLLAIQFPARLRNHSIGFSLHVAAGFADMFKRILEQKLRPTVKEALAIYPNRLALASLRSSS